MHEQPFGAVLTWALFLHLRTEDITIQNKLHPRPRPIVQVGDNGSKYFCGELLNWTTALCVKAVHMHDHTAGTTLEPLAQAELPNWHDRRQFFDSVLYLAPCRQEFPTPDSAPVHA